MDWAKPCPKQVSNPAALIPHSINIPNGVHAATLNAEQQPLQCGCRDLAAENNPVHPVNPVSKTPLAQLHRIELSGCVFWIPESSRAVAVLKALDLRDRLPFPW